MNEGEIFKQLLDQIKPVEITADRCPDCGAGLGTPFRIESKVVEEILQPQPVMVTEYKIAHYKCPHCHREVIVNEQFNQIMMQS